MENKARQKTKCEEVSDKWVEVSLLLRRGRDEWEARAYRKFIECGHR